MSRVDKPQRLSIKQFAALCRTTTRTIRFYSDHGLINPVRIDRNSNYRYYEPIQVRKFLQIKLLQNFHFSLEEIKSILRGTNKDKFLEPQLQVINQEIQQRQKELAFLTSIREFLFAGPQSKTLQPQSIGPFSLFCRIEESGSYDQFNNYITQLQSAATNTGFEITDQAMVVYLDPSPFKPRNTRVEVSVICQGDLRTTDSLTEGYYLRHYPKTNIKAFDYYGPYEYIPLIYQKFQESKYGISELNKADLGWDLYLKGPWNASSEYDHHTKICFPANTNLK